MWRGNEVKRLLAGASDDAIMRTLGVVRAAAVQEVPHDEGTLQESAYENVKDGKGLISFGGGPGTGFPKVPYALRWHENSANFQKGRKSRYLADPFNRLAHITLKRMMKREVSSVL